MITTYLRSPKILQSQSFQSKKMFQRLFGRVQTASAVDSNAIQEAIQTETSTHQVVVYSKTYCPYCTNTKQLFSSKFPKIDTKVIELDKMSNGNDIQSTLAQMTGQRTVPSVWVKGDFVGGNDDTMSLFHSGKLSEMLK